MKVQVTAADYLESLRFDNRTRPFLKQFTLILLMIAVAMLGLQTQQYLAGEGAIVSVILFAFTTVYLLVLIALRYWVLVPRKANKIYSQQRSLHLPFDFTVVDDGLKFQSDLGSGVLPWDHIYRWRETENLILIDHSEVMCNLLPKRDFPSAEELENFCRILDQKVGPANVPRSSEIEAEEPSGD